MKSTVKRMLSLLLIVVIILGSTMPTAWAAEAVAGEEAAATIPQIASFLAKFSSM